MGKKKRKKKIIVAVSGYFDPLHIGHLEMFDLAKKLGDELVVIVNSDEAAKKKKGYYFMCFKERMKIIKSIHCVDKVVGDIDKDGTVRKTLAEVNPDIFAQGGDRHEGNIPETPICKKYNIKIVDGLGKKVQSSSKLVEKSKILNDEKILDELGCEWY